GDTFTVIGASNGITGTTTLNVTSGAISVQPLSLGAGQGIGLKSEYYSQPQGSGANFTGLLVNRLDANIPVVVALTNDPDGPGAANTNAFSAVWTGFIVPDFTEQYIFQSTLMDDGSRLYINNQ